MSDFVYENVVLDFPKTDLNPLPPGGDPTKHLRSGDWNKICQALMDVKNAITNGQYFQLDELGSIPVGVAGSGRLRFDLATHELQISINGAAYVTILHAGSTVGGQLGGTLPNPDVRGIRETGGPTLLTIGSIPDGKVLGRSGSTVIGVNGGHIIESAGVPITTRNNLNFTGSLKATDAGSGPDSIDVDLKNGFFGNTGDVIARYQHGASREDNDTTTPKVVGAFAFNPSEWSVAGSTRVIKFRAVASPGNASVTGRVKLFNATDSVDVVTLAFTGSTATLKVDSAALTVPANLPNSEKVYEVHVYVDSHVSGSDLIVLYSAGLFITNTVN